ncbi:MAG: 4-alpha-glucanotransferase [Muribaculaceae bacterium]|nr:4-alpha-glucanotransferase [Muribaculaceae bacterium]
MKLIFEVDYRTEWGESLYICGSPSALGADDSSHAVRMELTGGETWRAVAEVADTVDRLTYRYIVRHDNGSESHEWGKPHMIELTPDGPTAEIVVKDRWQDQPWDKPYYSAAFTDCICRRTGREPKVTSMAGMLTLCVDAPMVKPDEVVAVSGETDSMGAWDPAKALRMSDACYPTWKVNIPLSSLGEGCDYKFLIVKKSSGDVVAWEGCDNRHMSIPRPTGSCDARIDAGQRLVNPLTPWRGAGVAIPVFSLRSDEDFGVGDFMDLKKMVDWAAQTRQNVVQLLPINDTTMTGTWTDSYPYNANSTFALHPMYLRLQAMGRLRDEERQRYFDNLGRELNRLPQVDYERVNAAKNAFTRELFTQERDAEMCNPDMRRFIDRNRHWLTPYAAFCVLRDLHGTPDMSQWGEYAVYDEVKVDQFIADHEDAINYVYYLQYHLDKQMREVHEYAGAHGVALKGDIPIGISRTSVDAWISPRLFNLDCQAGAPPDDFSVLGQNWGFPTYNWDEMAKDGFAWWKARFRKMAEYFDAYRIDHVLGFFRIWQIPMDAVHGLLGVFNRALPYSPDEMKYSYDFWLDVDRQTRPYIRDWMLGDFFGEYTDEVRETYLTDEGYGMYRLRDEYSTQRKVVDHFATMEKNDKNEAICNALLGLIDDVLFIEDPYEKGKYHPRISAQHTYQYRALNDYEKWCFNRLYNDFFYRRNNDFWYGKAMWKMPPLIEATDMLTCAEDLGMIPACVPAVMNALEILVLEIQRMPKDPTTPFGNTWNYPYYSVCTTSTHDMDGIRRWWEADRETTQRFFNEVLREPGEAPQYAEPWICERIINLHLKSPSMLCILPLQDWLSTDGVLRRQDPREELINIPANPRHYWRYRMHLTLEQLCDEKDFNTSIRDSILSSGR